MATAMIHKDCPQCGAIAPGIYYTRSGEEELQCSTCGYSQCTELVIPVGGAGEEAPSYRVHERRGFGCYFFQSKDGVGQMGGLEKELSDEDIDKFRRRLDDPDVDASRSWLTRWNGIKKSVEVIFGTPGPIE